MSNVLRIAVVDPNDATRENLKTVLLGMDMVWLEAESAGEILADGRRELLAARGLRVRPFRDEKVLTSWNALMISALAAAADALDEPRYRTAAKEAAEFLLKENTGAGGRLLRHSGQGEDGSPGYLEDYAFLATALLDLYQSTLEAKWLGESLRIAREMVALFRDEDGGGFFFRGKDSEQLIARSKEIYDGAVPSGNAAAALLLLRLGHLTADRELEERGLDTLDVFSGSVKAGPTGCASALAALDFSLGPRSELVLAGEPGAAGMSEMLRVVQERFLPNMVVALHEPGPGGEAVRALIPYVGGYVTLEGKTTAYMCENYMCRLPVTDAASLEAMLEER